MFAQVRGVNTASVGTVSLAIRPSWRATTVPTRRTVLGIRITSRTDAGPCWEKGFLFVMTSLGGGIFDHAILGIFAGVRSFG